MASFKISGSISTLPLSLILGIISIQIIFQLSSDRQQSLDIESETISAYFNRNDRPSPKTSSSKSLATYNLSTMSPMNTANGSNGTYAAEVFEDDKENQQIGSRVASLEKKSAFLEKKYVQLAEKADNGQLTEKADKGPLRRPKAQRENQGDVQVEIRSVSDSQKSDTSTKSLTDGDGADYFPVRVSVARREKGEPIQPGPCEIFMIPSDSKGKDGQPFERGTRENLIHKIHEQFSDLERRDPISRRNIPGDCFWGDRYEVESIRINWDPKNPVSYENTWGTGVGRNETEVTDFNAKACLTCLKKAPINTYSLNILIGEKGLVKENRALEREDATLWEESIRVASIAMALERSSMDPAVWEENVKEAARARMKEMRPTLDN